MIFGMFTHRTVSTGVCNELAPTAVRVLTNVGTTDDQCAALIASGQAAH
jgi:hypothetical protein